MPRKDAPRFDLGREAADFGLKVGSFVETLRSQDENSAKLVREIIAAYCAHGNEGRNAKALLKTITGISPKLKGLLGVLIKDQIKEIMEEIVADEIISK